MRGRRGLLKRAAEQDPEIAQKIRERAEQGESLADIADWFALNTNLRRPDESTVGRWVRRSPQSEKKSG